MHRRLGAVRGRRGTDERPDPSLGFPLLLGAPPRQRCRHTPERRSWLIHCSGEAWFASTVTSRQSSNLRLNDPRSAACPGGSQRSGRAATYPPIAAVSPQQAADEAHGFVVESAAESGEARVGRTGATGSAGLVAVQPGTDSASTDQQRNAQGRSPAQQTGRQLDLSCRVPAPRNQPARRLGLQPSGWVHQWPHRPSARRAITSRVADDPLRALLSGR